MAVDYSGLSKEELLAKLQAMEAAKPSGGIKVAEKGGISYYGLMRFPVTLFANAWVTVLEHGIDVLQVIVKDNGKLSFKTDEQKADTIKRASALLAKLSA